MIVSFTKMHGLGNDFVIIDLVSQSARLQRTHIERIANRKFGIGCDQVIIITPPTRADADFFYKIFNTDGQEVEQCGNGLRCAAKFFRDAGLTNKDNLVADCVGGSAKIKLLANDLVDVEWQNNHTPIKSAKLNYPDMPKEIHCVSVGNPHGICMVDDLSTVPLEKWGKILTKDPLFPQEANISFVQIVNRHTANIRVYERGVGPTLACGSAACATAIVGAHLNLLDNSVNLKFEVGELSITIDKNNNTINMIGPATSVYIGRFKI